MKERTENHDCKIYERDVNRRAGAGNAAGAGVQTAKKRNHPEPAGRRDSGDWKLPVCQCVESRKRTGHGMDGHLYTAADEEMPPAFYQILLRLLAEELPGSALTVRVGKLREEGEKGIMFFKNGEHRRRFRALMRCGLYPGLVTEPGFAAALFLLSSEEKLWEKAGPFVQERSIDYNRFRLRGADLDSYATFCVAKELCTGKPYVSLSELGDPELFHDGLLRLIIHAVLISRHGIGTVLNEEEVEC